MNVSTITIHCSDFSGNKHPRATVGKSGDGVSLDISTEEDGYRKITFFMEEQDLINFKNSVISAVENYKRGNK